MTKRKKIILGYLALLGLLVALAVYAVWLRSYNLWPPGSSHIDVQVLQTEKSPNDRWTAVVQQEVYGGSLAADYAQYAVRLKGSAQKDPRGDLVMAAELAYPVPRPFIRWSGGKLVVTLLDHAKYQYLANRVSGVAIDVQRK